MRPRHAQLVLAGVLAAFFSPVLLGGRVILGHDLGRELGAFDRPGTRRIVERLSDDQTSTYLPELAQHLSGARSAWLATWNPHVELGRPASHLSGLSRAFLPAHVVAWLTRDPLVAYTWLALVATALAAAFGYGFLRALSLEPAAALLGALGFTLSAFAVQCMSAVMFLWGTCWTLALLWAVVRCAERVTWPSAVAAAFSVHALLLAGYPQQVVWHAYLIAGLALARLACAPGSLRARLGRALLLGAAVIAGAASALPVLADVRLAFERSGRIELDPSFFLAGMRGLDGLGDVARLVAELFDPFWYGDLARPGSPIPFHGLCTGALGALLPLSLGKDLLRRLWPLHALVLFALAVSLSPGLYRFGIEHLGLGLSRFGPRGGAVLPAVMLAAFAADGVLRRASARPQLAAIAVLAVPATALVSTRWIEAELDAAFLALGLALCLGVALFVWTRSPWLLALLAVLSAFHYGFRLMPLRRLDETPRTSPLVEAVRAGTEGGRRFAWVGTELRGILPANIEALVGLASVHAYDPLAWERYRAWVLRLSRRGMEVTPPGGGQRSVAREKETYGRHFRRIEGDELLGGPELARAGVSLLLSGGDIAPSVAERIGAVAGVGLFRPRAAPVLEAQLARWREDAGGVASDGAWDGAERLALQRVEDRGDRLAFRLTPCEGPTLLFVSQQFHPQWRARAAGRALETVLVDGFYQGVRVPPGTGAVELEFRPHARWAWLPQVLFALAGSAAIAARFVARRAA